MNTIIIATDFSKSSRNAMHYTYSFVHENGHQKEYEVLLVNVYTQPTAFSAEGLALSTITDFMEKAEDKMDEELEWTRKNYPDLSVRSNVIAGRLHEVMDELVADYRPSLVAVGAGGDYDDLWSWGSEILGILRDLKAPVLVVPAHVVYKPIRHICYACNYRNVSSRTPFKAVIDMVEFTRAKLDVVYVATPAQPGHNFVGNGEQVIHDKLSALEPAYTTLENPRVIEAIVQFVQEHKVDLLLTTPQKYGIWESIFHKSSTSGLAKLNRLPVLALREK